MGTERIEVELKQKKQELVKENKRLDKFFQRDREKLEYAKEALRGRQMVYMSYVNEVNRLKKGKEAKETKEEEKEV